jgi:hypothetical protein
MKTEKNGQISARNPKKAWETLQELIFTDENMTMEELDEELRRYGIDPDDSVRRLVELAQRLSRESGGGGSVSPYVSDILSQLTAKCYRSEVKATETQKSDASLTTQHPSQGDVEVPVPTPKARAALLSYYRNYKDETENDRAIRLRNERRLQEMDEDAE